MSKHIHVHIHRTKDAVQVGSLQPVREAVKTAIAAIEKIDKDYISAVKASGDPKNGDPRVQERHEKIYSALLRVNGML